MSWGSLDTTLLYGDFAFVCKFKRVKYLRLKLNSQGEFRLTVPFGYPKKAVLQFLTKNEHWIEAKFRAYKENLEISVDKIEFLGKFYELKFDENALKVYFQKEKHSLRLIAPNEAQLEVFLKNNAYKIYSFYIKKWQKHFQKRIVRLSIKKMTTRWGSCNGKKAYINLNLKLIAKPLKAIEYVVLHELTHLKFPHHQQSFYDEIYRLMPDFKEREHLLKIKA